MLTTIQAVDNVVESAKTAKKATRVWDTNILAPVARQGDVYLRRLPLEAEFAREMKLAETRQIAPGDTPGSRHVLNEGPQIFNFTDAGPLEGPVIRAPEGFYLSHPTHGDIDCRLPGTYVVTFPVDKRAEELGEIRRRRD